MHLTLLLTAVGCSGDAEKADGVDTSVPVDDTDTTADTDDTDDTGTDTTVDTDDTDTVEVPACGTPESERPWCLSCAELLAVAPDTADGPVTLEVPPNAPFDTYCDMTTAGGGWTLAATNAFGGYWVIDTMLGDDLYGESSLVDDYKGEGFTTVRFSDLLFETGDEYAVYLGVDDGSQAYKNFQDTVPLYNCGIGTPYEWEMAEGNLDDPDICSTNLYIHPIDWEGGLIPCGDSEVATGPAWSAKNKDLGCPLNDPRGTCFMEDPWDYSIWGDHDPLVQNVPLRMWVR